jgi:predicted dehydrogenase
MKVGFIGCGGFVSGTHIPNAAQNDKLKVRAFCDLNAEILAALDSVYHPDYVTGDMKDIFLDPEIEMVVCGTKPDFRIPIMEMALKHGKHLFVEKPLCYDKDQIAPMVKMMRDAPIKFMVGFNRPYSPMMRDIKPLFKTLKKGSATILYRIIGEARLWPKHHYDAIIHNGESTIIHEVTHIFDILNWLTDSTPRRVFAAGEGNTDNVITLNYPDHITAVIIAGDNSSAGFPKEWLEINTGHSTIVGDNFVEMTAYQADLRLINKIYPYAIGNETFTDDGRTFTEECWKWRTSITAEEKEKGYYYERMPKVDKGHYHELEFFRKTIAENLPSETDVVKGAIAQMTAEIAVDSWKNGAPMDIDFSHLYE